MGMLSFVIAFKCPKCDWSLLTQTDVVDFDPAEDKLDCPICKTPMDVWKIRKDTAISYPKGIIDWDLIDKNMNMMKWSVYLCLDDW